MHIYRADRSPATTGALTLYWLAYLPNIRIVKYIESAYQCSWYTNARGMFVCTAPGPSHTGSYDVLIVRFRPILGSHSRFLRVPTTEKYGHTVQLCVTRVLRSYGIRPATTRKTTQDNVVLVGRFGPDLSQDNSREVSRHFVRRPQRRATSYVVLRLPTTYVRRRTTAQDNSCNNPRPDIIFHCSYDHVTTMLRRQNWQNRGEVLG